MAVTGFWYTKAISTAFGEGTATIDWVADSASMKVALMQSTFTGANQSQTAASFYTNVSAYEITAFTNYTALGKALGTTTLTTTAGSGKTITFDSPDVTWTTATLTARGAVVYKDTGNVATSPVVAFLDFGADVPATAGDFTIAWHVNGIATVTVA
jgi:hypothetical protein